MSDISRQRLKRSIASALIQIDEMQHELAMVRAQCKILQEEMRAIRVRFKRSRFYSVHQNKSNLV